MKLLKLSKGKVTKISDEDFGRVGYVKWTASFGSRDRKYYAVRHHTCPVTKKRFWVRLHRYLSNCPEGKVVDHLNGKSLDNQRENLEIITQAENMHRVEGWQKKKEEPSL